jgi:DNA invertase Pin-like site-specific DNA recombinase
MAVFGYGRVSPSPNAAKRDEGSDESTSILIQQRKIADYCKGRQLPFDAGRDFYTDEATSGGVPFGERPAGRALCERVRRGDHVVVTRIDRAWRSLADFMAHFEEWSRRDVHVHVINFGGNQVDASTWMGRMFVQLLAVVAEAERAWIRERMADGIARVQAQGKTISPLRIPCGFKGKVELQPWGRKHFRLVHDEAYWKAARLVHDLRLAGWSYDAIRQHFSYRIHYPVVGRIKDWNGFNIYYMHKWYEKQLEAGHVRHEPSPDSPGR